jgi:hypothetical protein
MRHLAAIVLASCVLASCDPKDAAPTIPPPELRMSDGFWYCSEISGHPQHYIDHCYIEVMINASRIVTWDRIICFGEFSFTQVDEGKVRKLSKSFTGIVHGQGGHWPYPFKLFEFVRFPESYNALDPKLAWYQCKAINAGDDLMLPPRPLTQTN